MGRQSKTRGQAKGQHVLVSQITPYLPPEIWSKILGMTDMTTCLTFCNRQVAQTFMPHEAVALRSAQLAGHLPAVQMLIQHNVGTPDLALLAGAGHLHIIKFLFRHNLGNWTDLDLREYSAAFGRALEEEQHSTAKWMYKTRKPACKAEWFASLAKRADLEMMEWFFQRYPKVETEPAMDVALEHGHLEVCDYICDISPDLDLEAQLQQRINCRQRFDRQLLLWITAAIPVASMSLVSRLYLAAAEGDISQLKQLCVDGSMTGHCKWNVLLSAAVHDQREVALWAGREFNMKYSEQEWRWHLHCYPSFRQWLRKHPELYEDTQAATGGAANSLGSLWSYSLQDDFIINAARNNHHSLVKQSHELHEHTYLGATKRATDFASANNHREVVERRQENRKEGCSTRAMAAALEGGHFDLFWWLYSFGSDSCTEDAMDNACTKNFFQSSQQPYHWWGMDCPASVFAFMRRRRLKGVNRKADEHSLSTADCGLDSIADIDLTDDSEWAYEAAKELGHLHIVRKLAELGFKCTSHCMDNAARLGRLKVVKFLHEHRQEGCSEAAMTHAAKNGFLRVLLFLAENRPEGCLHAAKAAAQRRKQHHVVSYLDANWQDLLRMRRKCWEPETKRLLHELPWQLCKD